MLGFKGNLISEVAKVGRDRWEYKGWRRSIFPKFSQTDREYNIFSKVKNAKGE